MKAVSNPSRLSVLLAAIASCTSAARAVEARIDFGSPFATTASTSTKFWTNVTNPLFGTTKLIDFAKGSTTPWSLEVTKPFTGAYDTNGTSKPIGAAGQTFAANTTRDSFDAYASFGTPQITLRNLPTTDLFSLNLFASNMGTSKNHTGTYTIRGATTVSGALNATNNRSKLLNFNSIKPAADGTIRLEISGAAANNSSYKQVFLSGLTVTASHPVTPAPPVTAAGKNLLFFGNSFTAINDVPSLVSNVAVADGQTRPYVVGETADSRDFADQLLEVRQSPQDNIGNLPAGKKWDNVVLQDFSSAPTHNGDPDTSRTNAISLYNAVKATSPNVKPVMYETWAYRPTSAELYASTPEDGQWTNATQMQSELRTNYRATAAALDALDGNSTLYAGVGDKWQQAGFTDDLYDTYDDKHPSIRGSTLAALVLYSTIYKDNVSDIPWTKVQTWAEARGLTQADWTRLTTITDANSTLLTGASFAQIAAFAESAAASSVVPEPGSLAALLAIGATLRRHRR